MRLLYAIVFLLIMIGCGDDDIEIRLRENRLTMEGKTIQISELTDELKAITASGDTPLVKLTIYPEAPMGDVNAIRKAIREADIKAIRQYMK